jgi:hypothetical protein
MVVVLRLLAPCSVPQWKARWLAWCSIPKSGLPQ